MKITAKWIAALLMVGAAGLAAGAWAKGAAGAPKIVTSTMSEAKWAPLPGGPPSGGPQATILWGDPVKGPVGFLLKLPPGNVSGLHTHTSDYHGLVVQGTLTASESGRPDEKPLPAGSYFFQPGKQVHGNTCAANGPECIVYIHFVSHGIDFFPAKTAK
jgi:quercetin dioxygenase-like cupin family protein